MAGAIGSRMTAAIVLAIAAAGCRAAAPDAAAAPSEPGAAPPRAVRLSPVARGGAQRIVRGAGTVRLKNEVDLSFKIGGLVASVLVEEGQRVRRGQLLAQIDPTEASAARRQTDEAVAKAERDFERVVRLHASGALPVAQRDDAETSVRLAKAARDAASWSEQRATIVAPDDGRVDRRMVEPGEVVAPGRPVLHLSGSGRGAIVRFGVADRDALRLALGDRARVTIDARSDQVLDATVSQLATSASPASGTFDVEVKLDAPPPGMLSGLTAKVDIVHEEPAVFTVPIGAIASGKGRAAIVWLVDETSRVRARAVEIAFFEGGVAAVERGLDGGERVVAQGAADLEEGALVRVVP